MKQLDERNLKEAQAAVNQKNSRLANKAWFGSHKRLRKERLKVGDLVLLYNSFLEKSRTTKYKLHDKWRGPYRIREAPEDSMHYYLEELDGTRLKKSFAGDLLKRFFTRSELDRMSVEFGSVADDVVEYDNDDEGDCGVDNGVT
jgi:hypothetical protein